MKQLRYFLEALLLKILLIAFRALPLDTASWLGGFIARVVGPLFSAHKTAQKNLSLVLPEISKEEQQKILDGMWDNLGRVATEFSHFPDEQLHQRVTLHGMENLPPADKPTIFISAHLGNWELTYPVLHRHNIPITLVYRHANNPYVERMLARLREQYSNNMLAKGPRGAFKMARALKEGESFALLVDQKMNDGIKVPFFGQPAMTAPAVAQFALRYDMPIIPARIIRTKGSHFTGILYPPLNYQKTSDEKRDMLVIMTQINQLLESWIREHPEQWFWVHKRWPNS
jgi:Kdo2-lipid IVA lauroyltransferase/acyltransferase